MANVDFPLPMGGYSEGSNVSDTPVHYSGSINNMRPFDSLERRFRLGQRPGMAKVYDEQIASVASPIVAIASISVIDYLGTS